jgi:hypothetical protein
MRTIKVPDLHESRGGYGSSGFDGEGDGEKELQRATRHHEHGRQPRHV